MKSTSILEAAFISTGIALVVLLVGLNCLQGSAGMKLFGILECNYGLTSADFRVKIGAAAVFVLFLALLFGPILAVLRRSRRIGRSKRSG
jgi:hypothetical protein